MSGSRVGSEEMSKALANGIGGSRGLIDSSLPTAIFLVVYLVSGSQLMPAVWAALAGGIIVAVLRKVRGEPLQQIVAGLIGVGIAAFLAARTGKAEDFFLPGLLINLAYAAVFAVSALIRRPLVGYAAGAVTGDLTSWHSDPAARRAATVSTWLWAAMFTVRVMVQVPLYFAGLVGALGVAKLALGWPLFLLVAYMSYRIMAPVLRRDVEDDEPDPGEAPVPDPVDQQSTVDPPPLDAAAADRPPGDQSSS